MTILRASGLGKTYPMGDIMLEVLRGVDLSIETGDYVALMGPSGSGKSTLMNLLGCLDVPTTGNYELEGRDISRLDEDELAEVRGRRIGFVFQNFNLLARTTALENVMLPLTYHRERNARGRALAALRDVGLEHRAGHLPSQLSGGERQRVAIARALVIRPAILLADEPTGSLDSKSGAEILDLFDSLHRSNVTILMVTHDRAVAVRAEQIVHFRDGRIAEIERCRVPA